jgi:Major Facilitator Superfamily
MGLGILEDNKLEHVPGTALLTEIQRARRGPEIEAIEGTHVDTTGLKHDKSGTLVLVPQPSDSPNDPYNWPRLKKELFCVAYAFGCGAVGAVGPLLNPALVQASQEFGVSISKFNEGINGALICCLAGGTTILNGLAVVIGKRPVYLLSSVVCTATCFWAANGIPLPITYPNLLANSIASVDAFRAVQGFFMAPFEGLVPGSIADVWFVHERGLRTAIFNLGVLGGINVAGPISGSIYQNYGFGALYYGMAGGFILMGLLVFFFMPESAYHRSSLYNFDISSHDVRIFVSYADNRISPLYRKRLDIETMN